MAAACASLAALLAVHHPVADAQQGEAADVPPLIVFAEHEGRAARAALSAAAAATLEAIHSDPAASGVRIGHGSPAAVAAALDARVLSVVTPSAPGASAGAAQSLVTFTGVEVEHNDGDMTSLHAHDEATDSEVAVVIQGADVLGSIRRGDETWKIHPLGGGLTAVYHYDTSRLRRHPRGWGDLMLKNELLQRQAPAMPSRDDIGPEGAGADAGADAGDVIDVLVAYTPGARAAAGNIDAFIQFAIDNTHRIYANSNIGLRLRLVHKHQTSYTGHPSNMSVDLERLTATSGTIIQGRQWDPDGYMDEVHGLRDLHGADLVALVTARQTDNTCGVAWVPDFGRHPDTDFGVLGFSVTAWNCETITHHTFAHELGHNQGAAHDPDNTCDDPPCTLAPPPTFLYRYGRCNTAEGWHTTMSYSSNLQGSCPREIEYFSSPLLSYRGTPTGDAARRDNRRVLIETARQVARYRQSKAPQTRTHTLPLLTHASNAERQGFMRIINHSDRAGEVRISAIDDRGRRFGPVSLSLAARAAAHFNSYDLENGNSGKGLSGGVGNGSGNWRVELTTDLGDRAPGLYPDLGRLRHQHARGGGRDAGGVEPLARAVLQSGKEPEPGQQLAPDQPRQRQREHRDHRDRRRRPGAASGGGAAHARRRRSAHADRESARERQLGPLRPPRGRRRQVAAVGLRRWSDPGDESAAASDGPPRQSLAWVGRRLGRDVSAATLRGSGPGGPVPFGQRHDPERGAVLHVEGDRTQSGQRPICRDDIALLPLVELDDFEGGYASRHGRGERPCRVRRQPRIDRLDGAVECRHVLLRRLCRPRVGGDRYRKQLLIGCSDNAGHDGYESLLLQFRQFTLRRDRARMEGTVLR